MEDRYATPFFFVYALRTCKPKLQRIRRADKQTNIQTDNVWIAFLVDTHMAFTYQQFSLYLITNTFVFGISLFKIVVENSKLQIRKPTSADMLSVLSNILSFHPMDNISPHCLRQWAILHCVAVFVKSTHQHQYQIATSPPKKNLYQKQQ